MGAVDLVIQVESPGAVSRGLQRIGRAGHPVGEPSRGTIYPKHRGDLLEAAVVTRRMLDGEIEPTRYLRNPLDVLAQQIVAHVAARGETDVADVAALVRAYGQLRRAVRRAARQHARPARRPLPERGVRRAPAAARVGPGQRPRPGPRRRQAAGGHVGRHDPRPRACSACSCPTARASASSTRRWCTRAGRARRSCSARRRGASRTSASSGSPSRRRRASRARCRSGTATGPAARSSSAGRSARSSASCASSTARAAARPPRRALRARRARRRQPRAVPRRAGRGDRRRARRPHDRVERFRDEIGDWRVCMLSPFGTPVHAPWAMAIERRLADRYDMPVETMWGDDGIVLRLPEAADDLAVDELLIDPDDIDELVVAVAAADVAVLRPVPRVRRPGAAAAAPSPRPAHAVVAAAPAGRRPARRGVEVPDVPDPARDVARVPAGRVRRAGAARGARPAAQPGRQGRQRRHGQAEPDGAEPAVQLDRRLHVRGRRAARRAPGRGAGARPRPAARPARRRGAARAARPRRARRRRARAAVPHRRAPGALAPTSCTTCSAGSATSRPPRSTCAASRRVRSAWLAELLAERRAIEVVVAGETRFVAADDAARYRDALGCALPLGLPGRVHRARRPARSRSSSAGTPAPTAPFVDREVAARFGVPGRRVGRRARRARGRRPGRARRVPARRRPSRVVRRRRAAPAPPAVAGRAAPRGRAGRARRATPGSCRRGTASPASGAGSRPSSRRSACCRARRSSPRRSRPTCCRRGCATTARRLLDELCTSGDLVWVGAGAIGVDRRPRAAVLRRPARPAGAGLGPARPGRRARCPTRSASSSQPRGPASGVSCAARRPARPTPSCSPRCGISCGRARSPTTRSRRCAPYVGGGAGQRAAARRRAGGPLAGRGRAGSRGSGRRRAPVAGASSRRCSSRRRRPPRPRTPRALQLVERYGVRHPRGGARRGRRRRLRLGVRRAQGARGARPGAARLLRRRARRGAVRPARRRRPAARARECPTG